MAVFQTVWRACFADSTSCLRNCSLTRRNITPIRDCRWNREPLHSDGSARGKKKKRAEEKARRPRSAARDRVAKNHSLIFSPLHWHLGHTWKNDLRFVGFFFFCTIISARAKCKQKRVNFHFGARWARLRRCEAQSNWNVIFYHYQTISIHN